MKIIQQAQVSGKNVLVRIDSDVDIKDGVVTEDARIKASVPTLQYLLENGAKVTIIGHIGRPDGKEVAELKMRPVEDKLIMLLGTHQNWQILENLRFDSREEKNDPEFAKQLAAGQDLFVEDAFATCHRAHASTVGVAKILPAYAGLAIQKEVESLSALINSPADGCTIIVGGKKTADKLPVISYLLDKAENFLIGGVVANTFLAAQGHNLGKSMVETEVVPKAKKILEQFKANPSKKLFLPVDLLFSHSPEKSEDFKLINIEDLKDVDGFYAVDIGAETAANFMVTIAESKTIFWNGNLGVSEVEEFRQNTWKIAEAIGNSRAKKFAGGGDTSSFIRQIGLEDNFDFISNGGGATLEFLAGKKLPGLEVLE